MNGLAPTFADELAAAADTLRIVSCHAFHFLGRRHEVVEGEAAEPGFLLSAEARSLLAELLYETLHCRVPLAWMPEPSHWSERRDFAATLSAANDGRGTWEAGWIVRSREPDGSIVAEKQGTRYWMTERQLRPTSSPAQPGDMVAVRVPKERCNILPGFYLAVGDAESDGEDAGIVRLYWHLWAAGAAPLTSALTNALNRAGVPFELKLLADPSAFPRSDAAVLYLARDAYGRVLPLLRQVHGAIRRWLKTPVSAFAKRIAPGLGLAEDPGDGSSFGQHRATLLASAVASVELPGAAAGGTAGGALLERLRQAGWDPDRFYLDQASVDGYPELGP